MLCIQKRYRRQGKQLDLSLSNIQQAIKRLRRKNRPNTPNTVDELGNYLFYYEKAADIFYGFVKGADGSSAVLFTTEKLLKQWDKQEELFVDGTFDVRFKF